MINWALESGDPTGLTYGKPGCWRKPVGSATACVRVYSDVLLLATLTMDDNYVFYTPSASHTRKHDGVEGSVSAQGRPCKTLCAAQEEAERLAAKVDKWVLEAPSCA